MLTKKISKIFKRFSIQFEELLFDYETYEEPLLINTCSYIKEISKEINFEDLNTFFFNLALSHLNNTILYARKNNKFKFSEGIKKYPIVDVNNYPIMKKTLIDLNLIHTINIHLENWTDKSGNEIKRFFFLYKEN